MQSVGWVIAPGVCVLVCALIGWVLYRAGRTSRDDRQLERAKREFHLQREQCEARFFYLSANSGKPRGLRWTDCEFANDVVYVRDRSSRQLSALVSVTISFEAVEGGGMEDVLAVKNLRAATALFHYQTNRWGTEGRAIFNLNPAETIQYYRHDLEQVAREIASKV